jgi:hypothetical protein
MKSAVLLKLFGRLLIVSRAAGVAERLVLALVLFRWLARLFPLRFAFLASLVTIVVSAGDRSDPVASYNHDALLFAILSGFAASRVLEGRRVLRWSVVAGLFAGLSLLTKQTVGLGAVVVVPVAVLLLLANRRLGGSKRWAAGFAAGTAAPVAVFVVWLWRMGLMGVFGTMVFHQGPAAKAGHAGDFLVRELRVGWGNWSWLLLAGIAVAMSWKAVRRSELLLGGLQDGSGAQLHPMSHQRDSGHLISGFAVSALVVIGVAEALAFTRLPALEDFGKASIYYVLLMLVGMLCAYVVAMFRRRLTAREAQFCLYGVVSFAAAAMLSLSWPAFEAIVLPGLGLLVAATLDGTKGWSRRFVYLVLAAMVFLQVREKLAMPFSFGSLDEGAVREATARSALPELRGMRLPVEARNFIDGTTAIIEANSTRQQTVFTYPEMGLFYGLADRTYPTLSGSHNVDVVNDSLALEESERLLRNPPAVLVFFAPTTAEVKQEDDTWRFGRPSGQHILVATVEGMLPGYRLAGTYRVSPESRWINVYVRR